MGSIVLDGRLVIVKAVRVAETATEQGSEGRLNGYRTSWPVALR
jgi:hypothetical protein